MTQKRITISVLADKQSFESIYAKMNKAKIEVAKLNEQIRLLKIKRDRLNTSVGRYNQMALSKRRKLIGV